MQNFGRGEVSSFLMKCPEEIGTPLSLQIWHDNSGGREAGWYLGKVVLIDLQQKRWSVLKEQKQLFTEYSTITQIYVAGNCQLKLYVTYNCSDNCRKKILQITGLDRVCVRENKSESYNLFLIVSGGKV